MTFFFRYEWFKLYFCHRIMKTFRHIFLLSAALILTLCSYFGVRNFEFVNWDDNIHVVNNDDIEITGDGMVRKVFTSAYAGMYQPLTTLTFAIDNLVYGKNFPGGFHLTSLLLHLLNIIFLYLLFRRLGLNLLQSGILVLFFALHPIQVEVVSWISARSTLLFSMFYILALICYSRFAENRNSASFAATFFFFLLSLLSKPSAASFFLFIPVIEYWFFPKLTYRTLMRMLLFAVPAAAILYITFITRNDAGIIGANQLEGSGLFRNVAFAMWSVILYLRELVLPLKQQVVWLYPEFSFYMFFIPVLIIILLVFTFIRLKKYRKVMLLSASFILIPLSVHLKFIPFGDFLMAGRYAYLSVAGILILPVWFFSEITGIKRFPVFKISGLIFISVVFVIFTVETFRRKETWKNSNTLWSHVVKEQPDYFLGYYNRGIAFRDKGFMNEAIPDFTEAIRCNPDFTQAYLARGTVFSVMGEHSGAINDFTIVIRKEPVNKAAWLNRANAEYNSGNYISALNDYKMFLGFEPMHEEASFFKILSMIHLDYAIPELKNELAAFIEKFPDNPEGYYFRGMIILEEDIDFACNDFRIAAKLGHEEARMFSMEYCF